MDTNGRSTAHCQSEKENPMDALASEYAALRVRHAQVIGELGDTSAALDRAPERIKELEAQLIGRIQDFEEKANGEA